jgi:hypothetical protein
VPEKAKAFLRVALLPASDELLISVAFYARLAAPDQRKASFFQTHHGAGGDDWRVALPILMLSSNQVHQVLTWILGRNKHLAVMLLEAIRNE